MSSCIDKGWIPTGDPRYESVSVWSIMLPAQYAEGSPNSREFPPFRDMEFPLAEAIWKEVVQFVLGKAFELVPIRFVGAADGMHFPPGAAPGVRIPLTTITAQGIDDDIHSLMDVFGYLLQVDEVHAIRHEDHPTGVYAMDICLAAGFEDKLAEIKEQFATVPRHLKRGGVLTDLPDRPGFRFSARGHAWCVEDYARMSAAADCAAREACVDVTFERLMVNGRAPDQRDLRRRYGLPDTRPYSRFEWRRAPRF